MIAAVAIVPLVLLPFARLLAIELPEAGGDRETGAASTVWRRAPRSTGYRSPSSSICRSCEGITLAAVGSLVVAFVLA